MITDRLPPRAGVGFKPEHFEAIRQSGDTPGFFEIHAENYMGDGGMPHAMLGFLRQDHALSIHGVGLSIGGMRDLDRTHLMRLKTLCDRYEPESFSEHLAWSSHDCTFFNDLLPLPYTNDTLRRVADHIDEVQTHLGRRLLLENPATYLIFSESTWAETDFLAEIVRRTGCGLLLDVNNVFVSSTNHQADPRDYLAAFPLQAVGEIHLGGHSERDDDEGGQILIDSHDAAVIDPVWALYEETVARVGPVATLIEWDNDVPEWPVLREEAKKADRLLARSLHQAAE